MKRSSIFVRLLLSIALFIAACTAPLSSSPPDEHLGTVASALTSTTYQGESMLWSGTEGVDGQVRTTPAPTHRYFWANGYIQQNHTFIGGQTTITVRAAGDLLGGVGPRITLTVGGVQIGSPALVNTTTYQDVQFAFTATAGAADIRVTYDNDDWVSPGGSGNDRNLLVDYVRVDEPDPPPACADTTYEGEAMSWSGTEGVDGEIRTTPAPAHRYFWSNGYVFQNHAFAAGTTRIRVRAAGDLIGGVGPRITVTVGGVQIGSPAMVNTTSYQDFTFTFTATAGTQEIRVTYDNDQWVSPGGAGNDRNLLLDKVDVVCGGTSIEQGTRSALFPTNWQPGFQQNGLFLQDYSYAGYHYGDDPPVGDQGKTIYSVSAGASLTTINTAIANANNNPNGGIVQFAAGTYTLNGNLNTITRSGVILRGAGPSGTKLRFTNSQTGSLQQNIKFAGSLNEPIPSPSNKYDFMEERAEFDTSVLLRDASGLVVGDEVHIGWNVTTAFKNEHHPGTTTYWTFVPDGQWRGFFRRNITQIVGNRVYFDIPLRYKVKLRDVPTLRRVTGYISECGLESLAISNTINMADAWNTSWSQHAAVRFDGVKNCWVRNVQTYEGQSPTFTGYHLRSHGISVKRSRLLTIMDTNFQRSENRGPDGNGYIYEVGETSHDVLFKDAVGLHGRHNFVTNFGFGASGIVFLRITSDQSRETSCSSPCGTPSSGTASGSDFHHALQMANLVDNSIINDGWTCWNRRDWSSGAGMTCAQNVFWNNRGTTSTGKLRSWQFGTGYVIGTRNLNVITTLAQDSGNSTHYEGTSPDDYTEFLSMSSTFTLSPTSLYEEQRQRRLNGN
jgi:hypothetical protein